MKRWNILATLTLVCALMLSVLGVSVFLAKKTDSAVIKDTVEDYLDEAEFYEDKGEYEKAVVSYKKALDKDSEHSSAIRGLAEAYLKIGSYKDAEVLYRKLKENGVADAADIYDYINVLVEDDKGMEAKEVLQSVPEQDKDDRIRGLEKQILLEAPRFNLSDGSYSEYQLLEVLDPEPSYTYRYTTDGSEPGEDSEVYYEPLVISFPENNIRMKAYSNIGFESEISEVSIRITARVKEYILSELEYNDIIRWLPSEVFGDKSRDVIYNYELAQIRSLYVIGDSNVNIESIDMYFWDGRYGYEYEYAETDKGNRDLSGLKEMPFLKTLAVCNQQGFDMSLLSGMRCLKELSLLNDGITDIKVLSNMSGLEKLALGWNRIRDVSPLNTLVSLRSLGLWDNRISDISSLSSLTELYYFDISGNSVSDISSISGMKRLSELWYGGNPVKDESVLQQMTDLKIIRNGEKR